MQKPMVVGGIRLLKIRAKRALIVCPVVVCVCVVWYVVGASSRRSLTALALLALESPGTGGCSIGGEHAGTLRRCDGGFCGGRLRAGRTGGEGRDVRRKIMLGFCCRCHFAVASLLPSLRSHLCGFTFLYPPG